LWKPLAHRAYTTPPKRAYINMAHANADELAASLQSLGLQGSLDTYPNCYPEINTVDIYRAHITSILSDITGVDRSIVYPSLQWTQTLEKGDMVLPVAALRVKGKKPNELAEEWAADGLGRLQFAVAALKRGEGVVWMQAIPSPAHDLKPSSPPPSPHQPLNHPH
ncbi:hypothetical protein V491_08516, partial [Pseudogymnoascus sp. VKM F-3775]